MHIPWHTARYCMDLLAKKPRIRHLENITKLLPSIEFSLFEYSMDVILCESTKHKLMMV
jgi:hypothetical protein